MNHEVKVPEMGESIAGGILTAWLKEEGATIREGEELFELETDKATLSIPSPVSGILHIKVEADTEVTIGQAVATIDPAPAGQDAPRTGEATVSGGAAGVRAVKSQTTLSPAVRRVVAENKLNADSIQGTGKGGRLTKADALRVAAGQQASETPESHEPKPLERGPDLPAERQSRVKMTTIRKRIAERLVQSKQNAAHLTTFNEIDMHHVLELRRRYREPFEKKHGVRLGFMSFFIKACCRALEAFPNVNAMIDGEEIVYNHFYDIGVAVSTDRGLIVPVIRDADRRNFADIEKRIVSFVERARDKKLTPDELTGGTFSITNGGVFGSLLSTPIPNPPQTAILGMHTIQRRPVVSEEQIVIRPMMYVALSYDHRLIDGREAVSFLVKVKQLIEDPDQMLLDL
ncbi:MAG TPA: 2-oxoglutarate dehydrogenase complex dihydrolipoyllysine-residue succinyltransferase [Spirochaetia bacterium]|nr:2-oxoglutarate dehydrogenase complex dihydrolipoyllysine-residue succinyltransferase [Spirochaetia bacterium]